MARVSKDFQGCIVHSKLVHVRGAKSMIPNIQAFSSSPITSLLLEKCLRHLWEQSMVLELTQARVGCMTTMHKCLQT